MNHIRIHDHVISRGYNSSKDMKDGSNNICEKCVDTKFDFIKFTKK
jgi:hypothetical protein